MFYSSEIIYRRYFNKFYLKTSFEAILEDSPTNLTPTVIKINSNNSFDGLQYYSNSNRSVLRLGLGKKLSFKKITFFGEVDGLFAVKQHEWSEHLNTYVYDSTESTFKIDDSPTEDRHSYEKKSRYYTGLSGSLGFNIDLGSKLFLTTRLSGIYFIELSSKVKESKYYDNTPPTSDYHNESFLHPDLALKVGLNYKF